MQDARARADVPVAMTWNLNDLFPDPADWEAELEALDAARSDVKPYQGRLGDSAATLLACLNTVEVLQLRFVRVSTFAYLRNAQDGTKPQHQAAMARSALTPRRSSSRGRDPHASCDAIHRRKRRSSSNRGTRIFPLATWC